MRSSNILVGFNGETISPSVPENVSNGNQPPPRVSYVYGVPVAHPARNPSARKRPLPRPPPELLSPSSDVSSNQSQFSVCGPHFSLSWVLLTEYCQSPTTSLRVDYPRIARDARTPDGSSNYGFYQEVLEPAVHPGPSPPPLPSTRDGWSSSDGYRSEGSFSPGDEASLQSGLKFTAQRAVGKGRDRRREVNQPSIPSSVTETSQFRAPTTPSEGELYYLSCTSRPSIRIALISLSSDSGDITLNLHHISTSESSQVSASPFSDPTFESHPTYVSRDPTRNAEWRSLEFEDDSLHQDRSTIMPDTEYDFADDLGDPDEIDEHEFLNTALLSHIAVKLRDKVPRATHVKESIPHQNAFTGKDIVVRVRSCFRILSFVDYISLSQLYNPSFSAICPILLETTNGPLYRLLGLSRINFFSMKWSGATDNYLGELRTSSGSWMNLTMVMVSDSAE